MKKLLKIACGIWLAAVLLLTIPAYFVERNNNGSPTDGLGRPLSDTPHFMRMFTGGDSQWPGWGWYFTDMVVFWGTVGTTLTVLGKSEDE